jgi:hypothetical protein
MISQVKGFESLNKRQARPSAYIIDEMYEAERSSTFPHIFLVDYMPAFRIDLVAYPKKIQRDFEVLFDVSVVREGKQAVTVGINLLLLADEDETRMRDQDIAIDFMAEFQRKTKEIEMFLFRCRAGMGSMFRHCSTVTIDEVEVASLASVVQGLQGSLEELCIPQIYLPLQCSP